jgi:hypothetical protein
MIPSQQVIGTLLQEPDQLILFIPAQSRNHQRAAELGGARRREQELLTLRAKRGDPKTAIGFARPKLNQSAPDQPIDQT